LIGLDWILSIVKPKEMVFWGHPTVPKKLLIIIINQLASAQSSMMINLNAHKIHIQNTHLNFEEKQKKNQNV
jgi:replication-associated recombination protein RarA